MRPGAARRRFPASPWKSARWKRPEYAPLVQAGAEGLVVYQETYDRAVYADMHTAGPKRDFDWRLETPERAYDAGFRRLGIGALFGLSDWRMEAIAVAAHAQYLLRVAGKLNSRFRCPDCGRVRGVSAAHPLDGSRTGAIDLRLPAFSARCWPGAVHPRTGSAAQRLDSAGHYHDERRQPHRTGRLYRRPDATSCIAPSAGGSWNWRRAQANGLRMRRGNSRSRMIARRRKSPSCFGGLATSLFGKIGMRRSNRQRSNINRCLRLRHRQRPADRLRTPLLIEAFLVSQQLLPRSVVVEHNGEAVAPSEFATPPIQSGGSVGDREDCGRRVS